MEHCYSLMSHEYDNRYINHRYLAVSYNTHYLDVYYHTHITKGFTYEIYR